MCGNNFSFENVQRMNYLIIWKFEVNHTMFRSSIHNIIVRIYSKILLEDMCFSLSWMELTIIIINSKIYSKNKLQSKTFIRLVVSDGIRNDSKHGKYCV